MLCRILRIAPALLVAGLLAVPGARAGLVTLTDSNSTVLIDPASQDGVKSWTVDGVNQLYQQWFWYRVGDSGGQSSIDAISNPVVISTPGFTDRVDITYQNAQIKVGLELNLTGGSAGSGASDLSETIKITNVGTQSMPLRFFQYSDFDLDGRYPGDVVNITTDPTTGQAIAARQTGPGKSAISESVVAPFADRWEANMYSYTLDSLNGGLPYNLNNQSNYGPGDATWAFQWDRTLAPGTSLIISKDLNLSAVSAVPEPSSLVTGSTALLFLGLARFLRRRRAI
jgi:hypothetical protein